MKLRSDGTHVPSLRSFILGMYFSTCWLSELFDEERGEDPDVDACGKIERGGLTL